MLEAYARGELDSLDSLEELLLDGLSEPDEAEPAASIYMASLPLAERERLLLKSTEALMDHFDWREAKFLKVAPTEPVLRALVHRLVLTPEKLDNFAAALRDAGREAITLLRSLAFEAAEEREGAQRLLAAAEAPEG